VNGRGGRRLQVRRERAFNRRTEKLPPRVGRSMSYRKRIHANLNQDALVFPQKHDAYRLTLTKPLLAPLRKLVHQASV
jgi:hypothetical protein